MKGIIERGDGWIQVEKALLRAEAFINSDGEIIPITKVDVVIYAYVKSRVEYFQNQGKEYFSTQENISKEVGLSLSAIKRSMKKFISNNVIIGHKEKWRNYMNWRYSSVKDLVLYGEIGQANGAVSEGEKGPSAPSGKVAPENTQDWNEDFPPAF